jgi:RNA polymerase sigma factor (TIGR02999 family)
VAWCNGDQAALGQVLPLVEKELHRLAHRYMRRETPGHTLQTTALVNEAFIRLIDQRSVRWQNRAHFFAIAARIMRRILLNYARDRKRLKRGGTAIPVSLANVDVSAPEKSIDIIALDEALGRLTAVDERKSRVVELRFFGGLEFAEIAEVLQVSPVTVARDWKLAKAWLAREIQHGA